MKSITARLTLLRHGESVWNLQNRFTGWIDISLSPQGMAEAQCASKLLANEHFDVAFMSALLRAQDTLYEVLKQNQFCDHYVRVHEQSSEWYEHFMPTESDISELKIYVSEKLNERYYGDLQGLNKDWAKQRYGEGQVHLWRRSYDIPPPHGESLKMTAERTISYYQTCLMPRLQRGENVLVVAHGNSLRSIIMYIERMTPQQILDYELPTGEPHIYIFNEQAQIIDKYVLSADI